MERMYFEDFEVGSTATYGRIEVSAQEIVSFAADYDPQPMHLDEEAAAASLLGGLAASGWHTTCAVMRTNVDEFLIRTASQGAPGIREIRWLAPVRPGDVLAVRRHVLAARASRTKPALGIVEFRFEVVNQRNEVVMTQENAILFLRRDAEAA